MKLSSKFPDPV